MPVLTRLTFGISVHASRMARYSRLPKRLVWVAILFIGTGAATVSSEIEELSNELAPVLTNGMASDPWIGSIIGIVISGGLGALYIWTGYGLLRRWERWRLRAVYLSKVFICLLAIFGVFFAVGSLSGSSSLWIGEQQIQDPSSPLWMLGSITILVGLGVVVGLFVWALRVLQDDAIRREFFEEAEEVSPPA